MPRKFLITSLIVLLLAAFTAAPVLAAQNYYAERYDVILAVQPDGALIVTETIVFRFEGDPFTYAFRDLAFNNLDSITDLQASMDGQALPQGTGPGQVEIQAGRPLNVTWHFEPTTNASREFTLRYRVIGAVRQDAAGDTIIWRAIPEEHEYEIRGSTIRVEYPADIAPASDPTLLGASASMQAGRNTFTFTTQPIGEDRPVDVTVRFPAGSLISQPPAWQAQQAETQARTRAALPFGIGAAVLGLLAGLFAIIRTAQSFNRQDEAFPSAVGTVVAPPQELPPAVAAKLTGGSTGFLGTLFDLGRRGVLVIEEGPKRWSGRSFTITRLPNREPLRPHEQAFVNALFAKSDRVPLTNIANMASNTRFNRAVDEETVTLGLVDPERKSRRTRFMAASITAFILSGMVFLAGILLFNLLPDLPYGATIAAVLMGGAVAMAVAGFIGIIAAAVVSPLSSGGARQADAWKGFNTYIRQVTRGKEPLFSANVFDTYLPYAASFGLASAWAKFFQKQGGATAPAWFQGMEGSLDDGSFAAIYAAISSADSSASSSAGGAGGASGGGASGAG